MTREISQNLEITVSISDYLNVFYGYFMYPGFLEYIVR